MRRTHEGAETSGRSSVRAFWWNRNCGPAANISEDRLLDKSSGSLIRQAGRCPRGNPHFGRGVNDWNFDLQRTQGSNISDFLLVPVLQDPEQGA